jgi:D-3-phosphoglycerate dehydrogenase
MKITVLEPLGLPKAVVEGTFAPLRSAGHEVIVHEDRPATPADAISRIGDSEVVVIANMPFPGEIIRGAGNLKFLAVAFTGVNHVDIDACRERGVAVSNAAGFSTESVAELTIAMIIGMLRNVVPGDAALRSGGTSAGLFGRELNGMTVGIVGTGEIGRRVATVLSAFGVRLLGYNRTRYPEMEKLGMQYLPLDELLPASDIVSVHVALTPETTGLISAERVATMKPGSYLVNVARGQVVDSAAVAAALEEGRLAGAAIDVFEMEPPIPRDHPFLGAPNTLLLPHVAFGTRESFQKRADIVLENIEGWLSGDRKRVIL